MTDDAIVDLSSYLPMPQDPRILLTVPQDKQRKLLTLWALMERLTQLLDGVREPMIGQIKLAWWRDMMALMADNADAIPKGEPLLAEMTPHWRGEAGLGELVNAAEALLLAEDDGARAAAAQLFGDMLFALSGKAMGAAPQSDAAPQSGAGARWGLLWGLFLHRGSESEAVMLGAAKEYRAPAKSLFGKNGKCLMMLDRLAGQIAQENGGRNMRAEGLILLRIGLLGR